MACKLSRNACTTNSKTTNQYHNDLVEDGTISYEDMDEFKCTRRLKRAVHSEYAIKLSKDYEAQIAGKVKVNKPPKRESNTIEIFNSSTCYRANFRADSGT